MDALELLALLPDAFLERLRPGLQLRVGHLEAVCHMVERLGQLAQLVGSVELDPGIELAARQSFRSSAQPGGGAIHRSINDRRDQQHRKQDRRHGQSERVPARLNERLVYRFHRQLHVEDAENRLLSGVGVTVGAPAALLVVDRGDRAEHPVIAPVFAIDA